MNLKDDKNEYSDDSITFEEVPDLDDLRAFDNKEIVILNGLPKNFIFLGNPNNREKPDSNYSVDYYYGKKDGKDIFHIFRTLNSNKTKESDFPQVKYLSNLQKTKGISLIKLVEFNEKEKWVHFEYVPGGTLYDAIKYGRQFNSGDRFKILFGIAITLNNLHEKIGLTHLDIRLESVIATAKDNRPVLADLDMVVQSYKKREDYDDQHLPYLDPDFECLNPNTENMSESCIRADIFSFGVLMNLFLQRNIKPLEKDNIANIKKAYDYYIERKKELKNPDEKTAKKEKKNLLKHYLNDLQIAYPKANEIEDKLLRISNRCLLGKITSSSALYEEFVNILNDDDSNSNNDYLKADNINLVNELELTVDETFGKKPNSAEYSFPRSSIDSVESSASNLNAKDIWLINKYDFEQKKSIQIRAAEACLYATITQDFSLYEDILNTPENRK